MANSVKQQKPSPFVGAREFAQIAGLDILGYAQHGMSKVYNLARQEKITESRLPHPALTTGRSSLVYLRSEAEAYAEQNRDLVLAILYRKKVGTAAWIKYHQDVQQTTEARIQQFTPVLES